MCLIRISPGQKKSRPGITAPRKHLSVYKRMRRPKTCCNKKKLTSILLQELQELLHEDIIIIHHVSSLHAGLPDLLGRFVLRRCDAHGDACARRDGDGDERMRAPPSTGQSVAPPTRTGGGQRLSGVRHRCANHSARLFKKKHTSCQVVVACVLH